MMDYTNSPIIVTGCARSGTSMVAGVLHLCGAWAGQVTGPTQWNRKGQFENEYIRDRLTKPYLESLGADPMGQDPLPDIGKLRAEAPYASGAWGANVHQAMRRQGYPEHTQWMFKGAKACLIWPLWAAAFPEARWVIVRREDDKIVDSCMRTSFMRKRKTREAWQEWVDEHKLRFAEIMAECREVYQFWPGRALRDPAPWKALVSWLGLTWDEEKVTDFLEPKLWNGG